ncbi:MAG: hypothetical protein FWE80_02795 [Oscillospiraceae bacterium]|nr:hypothetical protein [Oscillospiraceae bacterium]
MGKIAKIVILPAIICTLLFGAWAAVRIVRSMAFSFDCTAYIKRAADASTVEMAKTELLKAIQHAEQNNLTEGIISIILKNPENDIGFWYNNMKAAYTELDSLPEDAATLEKTNMLMKLRESLTDGNSDGGITVTAPDGISIYPHNVLYFWWGSLSFFAACVFWAIFAASFDRKNNKYKMKNTYKKKR